MDPVCFTARLIGYGNTKKSASLSLPSIDGRRDKLTPKYSTVDLGAQLGVEYSFPFHLSTLACILRPLLYCVIPCEGNLDTDHTL
jgi:hypothetical protein